MAPARKPRSAEPARGLSRRAFVAGAGASAALGATGAVAAETADAEGRPIQVPEEIPATRAEPPSSAEFPMDGAQVFARACREEGLAALFCCPGNYPVINALAAEGIPTYGGRTEGSMCSAADGFIRVTGEIAACSGTEGPGFTNMIMNIGAAHAARTPLLVLASNMTVSGDDTERNIQRGYQQPTTEGLKKYGKRLIDPPRVWEYAGYAFRQLRTGVPRPVHLDFTGEVARHTFESADDLVYFHDKSRYRTSSKPAPAAADLKKAVEMIQRAERPMLVASTGVFYDRAREALLALAEKNDVAVVESGPTRGQFSDGHRLSASTAPDALLSADLVIYVGQYSMPGMGEYAFDPDAKAIRIDPDAADIGRNIPIDLGIVAGERLALEALAEALPRRSRPGWVDELAKARAAFEAENDEWYRRGLEYSRATGTLHPAVLAHDLARFLHGEQGSDALPRDQTTIVAGGYGVARYTRRYLRAYRPGQILNGAYQYGAIGPDVGYTVGAAAAVQQGTGAQKPYQGHPVVAITGDAGVAYSGMEIETLAKYQLPAVILVYNNNAWGTYAAARRATRSMHMYLFQENLRYEKIAEGLGGRGEYVTRPEDFLPALQRSYDIAAKERVTTLINCQAIKEFWTNDYPPGMPRKVEPGCMAYYH
ncbi:MAG TPA: thiamine pyrophosphate-binding protein [Thermoanaerobaculia bacterium]|nr:thiamine pyrophosphate-binding protein [Thermoanaerobaculia bacterium]